MDERMADDVADRSDWYADGLHFTCAQCGNCCTGPPGYVWFTDDEAARMAEFLEMSVDAFRRQYAHRIFHRWTLNEREVDGQYDCVFLIRDQQGRAGCSVYAVRPTQCRTWPFWPENLATPENYVRLARRCPGVKNGLEGEGTCYPIEQIRTRRDQTRG